MQPGQSSKEVSMTYTSEQTQLPISINITVTSPHSFSQVISHDTIQPGFKSKIDVFFNETRVKMSAWYEDEMVSNSWDFSKSDFFTGVGEIGYYRDESVVDPMSEKIAVAASEGYDAGYEAGYADGDEGTPSVIDLMILEEVRDEFPIWVTQQTMEAGVFACGADIRIELPKPDYKQFTALIANHDCTNHILFVTVVFDETAKDNFLGYVGAKLSKKSCFKTGIFDDVVACEFELVPDGDNLGILFKGGFTPVFYAT